VLFLSERFVRQDERPVQRPGDTDALPEPGLRETLHLAAPHTEHVSSSSHVEPVVVLAIGVLLIRGFGDVAMSRTRHVRGPDGAADTLESLCGVAVRAAVLIPADTR
jgi:hypothetical protein